MRLIISGGCNLDPMSKHLFHLAELKENITHIITSNRNGADKFAIYCAEKWTIPYTVYPVDWDKYGSLALDELNRRMVNEAEACYTFPGGKNTENLIQCAKSKNLIIFKYSEQ